MLPVTRVITTKIIVHKPRGHQRYCNENKIPFALGHSPKSTKTALLLIVILIYCRFLLFWSFSG